MKRYCILIFSLLLVNYVLPYNNDIITSISIKKPGNKSIPYELKRQESALAGFRYQLISNEKLPLKIYQNIVSDSNGDVVEVMLLADENCYFNLSFLINSSFQHNECLFYMPGFWYRKNLRSPDRAPSFHVSDSWTVREDRLSSPFTAIFNEMNGDFISVARLIDKDFSCDALTTHKEGEVILSGNSSLGYIGFENVNGKANLSFGFPYKETPKSYVRKKTLAPQIKSFYKLGKGEKLILKWKINNGKSLDYSTFVKDSWEYCYDLYKPQPLNETYSNEKMKEVLSNFFRESYVENEKITYFSGSHILVSDCLNKNFAEVGFVGRTLLNAFNALEYGEQKSDKDLVNKANSILESYKKKGFSEVGFFLELINTSKDKFDARRSIRRQSEGVYAILYYLDYERKHGRVHKDWEEKMKTILDLFIRLQNDDGSFPRKFKDDLTVTDKSGGSTPSATLPLIMGYKYFGEEKYLKAAKKTVEYLEKEIIEKADYFSSTLDANCEDKEASLYASTACYYLSLVSEGKEKEYYSNLALKAAYFALSWYYTWDIPFAQGQMLGDIGLKTRGWGNVSVENNHIDVFIFDFVDVLKGLAKQHQEPKLTEFAEVIYTSMRQLLPCKDNLCGLAKEGYYPEVVQHTNWDYGHNGKGFYNKSFAPGWVIASLWEMLTPGRAENFLVK